MLAACVIEQFPRFLSRFREMVVLLICAILFALGLSCVTHVSEVLVLVIMAVFYTRDGLPVYIIRLQ